MNNKVGLKEYRTIFDQASEGIFILSPNERKFILVNNRFCEMTGYSKAELLKLNILDTYNESEITLFAARSAELKRKGNVKVERSIKRKDGTTFYARINLQLLDNGWEKGVVFNVPLNKKIKERFERTEELFLQITEHIRDVFFLVDLPSGNVLYVSPSYETIWGKSVRSLLAKSTSWMTLIHPDDQGFMLELYKKYLKTGLLDVHYRIIRSDKSIRWIHARTFPVYDKKHQLYRSAGVAEDVSEHMQAQEERLEHSKRIIRGFHEMIVALSMAVEKRDLYTANHQSTVANLSVLIAKEMKLNQEQLEGLEIAAQIHDIGKIAIPAEILTKPGKLSHPEFELIKIHPQTGYDILKDIHFPWPIADIVLEHHERLDGSGYPRGLKANEIKIESKILAVADTVDALSSNRPYRPALGLNAAIAEISKSRGILFDPDAVDACVKLFHEKKIPFYSKNVQS
jgi:PAS domain S-box-containing protein